MSLFDNIINKEKTSSITVKSPTTIYTEILKQVSGAGQTRKQNFDIFYEIVAFKGVTPGVGCSTLVANVAYAIATLGLKVCVVDTSVKQPVQDILLKTKYKDKVMDIKNRLDWFDMPFTKLSPLHESTLHSGISVLSFYGKNRGIIDLLSTTDNPELVDIAFTELHGKFDIILVDCCDEDTSVNTTALQQSQHVIQVWTDTPTVVENIDNFINNCATLSCPLDKMRNVVYSQVMDDIVGNLDAVLEQYRLTKLAENKFSKDIRRLSVLGRTLYNYATTETDVINYTNCVINVACHVLNIHDENEPHGTITSNDIMEGKVEGTLHKELKDYNEQFKDVKIINTLEDADKSLNDDIIPATEYDGIPNNTVKSDIKDEKNSVITKIDNKVVSDIKEELKKEDGTENSVVKEENITEQEFKEDSNNEKEVITEDEFKEDSNNDVITEDEFLEEFDLEKKKDTKISDKDSKTIVESKKIVKDDKTIKKKKGLFGRNKQKGGH